MRLSKSLRVDSDIRKPFLYEKMKMQDMIDEELMGTGTGAVKCSDECLRDAEFAINRFFDDIMYDLDISNFERKVQRVKEFKDSLLFSIYGR